MNKKGFLGILIVLVIIGALVLGLVWYLGNNQWGKAGQKGCTEDAKICPDGSAVGRVLPDCEFAPCPDPTKDWQTYSNTFGFEMKFPRDFEIVPFEGGDPMAILSLKFSGINNAGALFVYSVSNITLENDKKYFANLGEQDPKAQVKIDEIEVDGYPALRINFVQRILTEATGEWTETPTTILKIKADRNLFSFICSPEQAICNQIFSTFRFII